MKESGKKKSQKPARGYTTGACAQAATRAAALMAATGSLPRLGNSDDGYPANPGKAGSVEIVLPGGEAAVFQVTMNGDGACSVVKNAGDDPDITDGVTITVRASPRRDGRVLVKGGEGVGLVTREGLPVKPGRPAINPTPLKQIRAEARLALPQGADITVSIPGGGRLARRTFNPRLGISGGLSILGTTGRVEPWSVAAYQDSLLPQLDVARASGVREPVLVPGAKGEKAAIGAGCQPEAVIHAGNFFGMMLGAARDRGFRQVVLAGHVSKLAKMARGDFDTHSRRSAMPLDVLAECATAAGLSGERAAALEMMPTTEAAIRSLRRAGDFEVLDVAAGRVAARVKKEYGFKALVLLTDGGGRVVGRSG